MVRRGVRGDLRYASKEIMFHNFLAIGLEAIATRSEAIPSRFETIAIRSLALGFFFDHCKHALARRGAFCAVGTCHPG